VGSRPAAAFLFGHILFGRDERAGNLASEQEEQVKSPMGTNTWISDWNPENESFWNAKGKFIARRNLIWSIVTEHIGFSVWLIWSIVATKLPQAGFHYSTDELFQLVALPGLIGSIMRFP